MDAGSEVVSSFLPDYLYTFMDQLDEHPWLFSALASILVGLSGILPLLIIPIDETASFKNGDMASQVPFLILQAKLVTLVLFLTLSCCLRAAEPAASIVKKIWAAMPQVGVVFPGGAINIVTIAGAATLKILLSFAVGGLLGDVFLHLLPEAWQNDFANTKEGEHVSLKCGLWCLTGMLVFIVVEKLFAASEEEKEEKETETEKPKQNGSVRQIEIEEIDKLLQQERKQRGSMNGESLCGGNGTVVTATQLYESCVFNNNSKGEGVCCSSITNTNGAPRCGKSNRWMGRCLLREAREKALQHSKEKSEKKDVAGYLNLMANSIDNFTHGLAVGGSFLVGFRVGLLTTFAILVHEIPHEVGDFAILLKSGFSRWEAAKAQMATASAGLIGAMTAIIFSGARNAIEAKTSWIVPFTAGGFLHIALVTVLPDLLREEDKKESLKHLAALISGIAVMAFMTHYFE